MEKDTPPESSRYVGQEYVEDRNKTRMRFDVCLHTPAQLEPFELFHEKRRIAGVQRGRELTISFEETLPRTLIDDIAWGRKNYAQYVLGYISSPLTRVNGEMLRQRYALGHFLVNTFSFFDITSIKITNAEQDPTDEVINVPLPQIFSAPPHAHFTGVDKAEPEAFLRDYVDAWADMFRGDYDNCIRKLVTSVENAIVKYGLKPAEREPWYRRLFSRSGGSKFVRTIEAFGARSEFIGYKVVCDNLIFLYKVRNRITHGSFRIRQENGWWLCGKALSTVQYFYQFLDGRGENSNGAYAFRTNSFAEMLFREITGKTVEDDQAIGRIMSDRGKNFDDLAIRNDKDMNEWKFSTLRITPDEERFVLKNKVRK